MRQVPYEDKSVNGDFLGKMKFDIFFNPQNLKMEFHKFVIRSQKAMLIIFQLQKNVYKNMESPEESLETGQRKKLPETDPHGDRLASTKGGAELYGKSVVWGVTPHPDPPHHPPQHRARKIAWAQKSPRNCGKAWWRGGGRSAASLTSDRQVSF